ncbi:MAG TPA: hypothetical protein PKU80_00140 [Candidatus Limiplasma sp.]|nr:hypothetical protein [Candidatus Limiplasma sp.]
MLYNTSFIRKEFRNSYTQQSFSYRRQVSLGVFLGLLTFALYFSFLTLKDSVISTAAPYLLLPSFFSTLYIYLFVSLLFNVWLYIVNYEYMTLQEVRENRWYALVQLWYSPTLLITSKIVARILAQLGIYTVGYLATLFLSSFLKFPLVTGYLFTMYFMGMLDVVLLAMLSLTMSLFIRDMYNARYMVGIIALCVIGFKLISQYFAVLSDRTRMNDLSNMFDTTQTIYMIVVGVVIVICVVLCLVKGIHLARTYNAPLLRTLPLLKQKPEGTVVVGVVTSRKRKSERVLEAQTSPGGTLRRWNLPSLITGTLVIIAIAGMVLVNLVVLAFGYASPDKETSISGIIPYVFQSHTMEPDIMYNDVAFFRKIDYQEHLEIGDIILYKDATQSVSVGEITGFAVDETTEEPTGELLTDIVYYADERYRGMAAQTVERDQVYGVHTGNNRWFGAIVLFANTILGRLILLLIPTFLIFFYEPIVNFFKTITKEKT